ncbi:hypothetical protein C8R43DRAFT_1115407, partial [Mycena crocata]
MLARRLTRPCPSLLRFSGPRITLPCYSSTRAMHWRNLGPLTQKKPKAHNAAIKFRQNSDSARARIEEEGIPLDKSGPTTAALLGYAETHWLPPPVVPPGWSTDWKRWPYLLTFFAYSPYFLRLPQIEMLVNIKYNIPGEVRPIMYSNEREEVVLSIDLPALADLVEEGDEVSSSDKVDTDAAPAQVLLLNCRTFDLYTYDVDKEGSLDDAPETVDELVLLIAAAPTPEGVPMMRLAPDPEGEATLKRVLDRDESVIPLLESDFLGYAPRATTREDEMVNPDKVDAEVREKFAEAIRNARTHIAEAEEELRLDAEDLKELQQSQEAEDLDRDEEAHTQMRIAVAEAKEKLTEWEKMWKARYGPNLNPASSAAIFKSFRPGILLRIVHCSKFTITWGGRSTTTTAASTTGRGALAAGAPLRLVLRRARARAAHLHVYC